MKTTTTFLKEMRQWHRHKLKLLAFFAMLLTGQIGFTQSSGTVQIGDGNSTINGGNAIPVANYEYNYNQQIITADEIALEGGATGDITKIRYKPTSLGNNPERWNELTVYIGNTTKTDFTSNTDWVSYTDLTEVFSGGLPTLTAGEWFELEIDQPFVYTGGNIVIAVHEEVPGYTVPSFQSYSTPANRGILYRTDTAADNPDPQNPPTATATISNLPQVQFEMALASCLPPINYTIETIDATNATISWEEWGTVPTEGFEWELLDENDTSIDYGILLPTDNFEAILSNLSAMTSYTLRVKSLCSVLEESSWSSITFTTPCAAFSEWTEDFDSYGTGDFLADCMERVVTGSGSLTITSTAPASGTRNIYMYSTSLSNRTMTVLPSFSNINAGTHWLRFKARSTTTNGTLKLGYVTHNNLTIDGFVELEDILIPNTTYTADAEQMFEIPTTVPANARLAILNPGQNSYSYYLDDFIWEEIPTCMFVSDLAANDITATGVELSWISDGTLFDIEIIESGEDPTGVPTNTGVGNPFNTANPLTPSTTYDFYVRQDCGFGDVSTWIGPLTFTTLCEIFTNPFTEDFDTTSTGTSTNPTVPECWNFIDTGTGYGYVSSSTPNTSPNNFYIYNSSDDSGDYILVSPETEDLGNGAMRVKFFARGGSSNQILEFGTLSDKTDASTFTLVETITLTTTHTEYTIILPVTTDDYFGFKHGHGGTYRSIYIDTISYEAVPSCIEVSDLAANGVTATGAELSWISDGTLFDVEIVESGEDPTGVPTDEGVDNPFITVNPLTPATTYDVYVRKDCGSGDTSSWVGPISFTTLCISEIAPTTLEDFTSYTGTINATSLTCWLEAKAENIGDPLTGTTSNWSNSNYNNDATHPNGNAVYINLYGTDNEWIISPVIDLGDGSTEYALRYDASVIPWTGSSIVEDMGSDKSVSTIISTDGGQTWSIGEVLTVYDNNNIPNNGGVSEIISLDGYSGEVRIAFFAKSSTTTPDLRFYIDNFRIEEMPTCLGPTTGNATNINNDSATINWEVSDSPNVSNYEYEVRTGDDDNEVVVTTGTTTPPVTTDDITGLDGATEYKVYVRSECGTGDFSTFNLVTTFMTLCDATDVPYIVPIDDTTGSELPLCVTRENLNNDDSFWKSGATTTGFEGRTMRYQYHTTNAANDWFYTAGLNLEAGQSYRLAFKHKISGTSFPEDLKVSFGLSAESASMTTELFDETLMNTSTELVEIDFIPTSTGVHYVGFQAHSEADMSTLYLGEISIIRTPTCYPPLNIEIGNITKYGAEVTWDEPELGNLVDDGYEVEIRTEGLPGETVGYVDTVTNSTLSVALSGLDPDTSYTVYIKSLCTEVDDESIWSDPISFRTLCDAPELISAPGGEVCGSGTTVLEAEYTSGTVEWYDSAEEGELLHTGETFTTPNITEETSFWVQAKSDDAITGNGGVTSPAGNSATTPINWGLIFDAYEPFVLQSVDVYLASSTAGTLVIRLTDSSGNTIEEQSIPVPAGGTASTPVLHTIDLDMEIPEGLGMRLLAVSGPSMIRDTALGGFPYDLGSVGQITNGYINGTSTTYYYFYNWQFEKGCYSERTEVMVEITDAPEFSLSADTVSVCGTTPSETVTVVEGLGEYDVFTWTPSTNVIGDENTGWTFSPTANTTYTLIASKSTEDCAQTVEVDVVVGNYPTPALLEDNYHVCINEVQMLNLQVPTTGTNAHTVTWSPVTNLYIDLAASVPYTNQNVNRVYFKSSNGVTDVEYTATVTNNNGCTVEQTTIINVPIIPAPQINNVYLCEISSVEGVNTLYNIDAVWYDLIDSQSPLNQLTETGTYYVATNADGCQSERVAVEVTVVGVNTPTTTETQQQFCDSATIEDILVSHTTGSTLNVYESETGGTALNAGANIYTGTFYVSEQIADCESDRMMVEVTVSTTPPAIVPQTVTICGFEVMADVEIGQQPNTELVWYTDETTSVPMNANSQVYEGTYYVSQKIGICESSRTAITFNVNDETPLPTASSQVFCGSAVVSDLVVTGLDGAMFQWFNSATSTTPLADDQALSNGTYYVSQEVDGCESNRKAISVQIVNNTVPQIASAMDVCQGATIGDVEIPATTGVTYKWYTTPVAVTALPDNTELTSNTYYISSVYNGCESDRVTVDVQTTPAPAAPTGEAQQAFVYEISINEVTIADLIVNEGDVMWFISEEDAATLTNPLPNNLPLSNNTTYYAVIVGNGGCVSETFAVQVTVVLDNEKFDRTKLNYYPNPTNNVLNIEYISNIESVEIYNTVGQLVSVQEFNSNQVTVDMSNLSSGTYMLKLQIDGYQQLIKVMKK